MTGNRSGRVVAGTTLRPADADALVPPVQLVVGGAIGRLAASAPTVYARGGWLLVHLFQALAVGLTLVLLRARRR